MNADRLLAHFEKIVDAPDAVDRVRTLVLSLAYAGRLLPGVESPEVGWHHSTVGEVATEIVPGVACSKSHQTPKGHVHLRTHNVATNGRLNFDLVIRVDPRKLALEKSGLRRGDVIFNNTNSQELVGKTCLVDQAYEYAFSNHLTRIRLNGQVAPEFFTGYFQLLLRKGFFAKLCNRWIGQAGINTTALKGIAFPFPALPEQHRIVEKVDELMQLCDRLEASQKEREGRRDRFVVASLNRLSQPTDPDEFKKDAHFQLSNLNRFSTKPEHIKELRKAILNLAVKGKLVPQDEKEDRNPSATGATVAEPPHPLPSGWGWVPLEHILAFGPQNGLSPKPTEREDAPKAITLTATTSGVFLAGHYKRVEASLPPESELWLRAGDLLFQRGNTREYVGIAAIYNGPPNEFIYPDLMIKVRVVPEAYMRFIHLAAIAPPARSYFSTYATGAQASMPKINHSILRQLPIPLPPLAEQKRIVAKVDELMLICDQLDTQLESQQKESRRLLEALLHDALEGVE